MFQSSSAAGRGGAIFATGGARLEVNGSRFEDASAFGGGAIFADGQVAIRDTAFVGCTAGDEVDDKDEDSSGGAIYVDGSPPLAARNSRIQGRGRRRLENASSTRVEGTPSRLLRAQISG